MSFTRSIIVALALAMVAGAAMPAARAAGTPCEDMLKTLRAKEAATPPAAASKAAFEDLKAKGIERCNADDDKRADDFFAQAIALLGK